MRTRLLVVPLVITLSIAAIGEAGAQELRVGSKAPDFTLTALDSSTVQLAALRGHPVIINFWATWCPPCIHEMPELASRFTTHGGEGLVVLAVNGDREKEGKVRQFTASMALPFPVLLDPKLKAATAFGVTQLPVTVFVDSAGMIRQFHEGPILASQLDEGLRAILPATP